VTGWLVAVLVGAPLLFVANWLDAQVLRAVGYAVCLTGGLGFVVGWGVFVLRWMLGHYRDVEECDWRDQVW
jgi:hypothetical protein